MIPDRSFTIFIGGDDGEGTLVDIKDLLGADFPTKDERTHQT